MKIGLVAHDGRKGALLEWCAFNRGTLSAHTLIATGTTGALIEAELFLDVEKLLSGPKGGDQQIGALIATQQLDMLIFFWDPETPAPHDPDVKALLRLATYWNIPTACSVSTADMLISSPLFHSADYTHRSPDASPRAFQRSASDSSLKTPAVVSVCR
jgi:methylglyoxal synthase